MNRWEKGAVFALSAMLLLSLCLTSDVLAEEGAEPPIILPAPVEPAAEPLNHGAQETTPASRAGENGPVHSEPPPSDPPGEPGWREAATLEELEELLYGGMMQNGGQIRITGDLLIPAGELFRIWPSPPEDTPLVVDLGAHTLTVEGTLAVTAGIEFTGAGGETGLIRVKPGGSATLIGVLFTVTEPGGCAVWQEEGGILSYTPHEDTVGEIRFAPKPEAEAASFAELAALLEDGNFRKTGGRIRATADLTVPTDTNYLIWPNENAPLTVDLGKHALIVEGELIVRSGVEFTGAGGENGLVRVRTGGKAAIVSTVRFTVTAEGGYAVWQEEGGILDYEPDSAGAGRNIHFAQRPVATPHSAVSAATFTPVALVRDGQALGDALPVTDSVQLYRDGAVEDMQIPVTWELEPYRAQLDGRERVLLTGSYPDAEAFQTPACLIAFQNGNPATILNCYGTEGRGVPSAMVQLALAQPELGCRFEWSQDGETWLPAGAEESPEAGEFPVFYVTFPQETLPAYPYYLSAVVQDPDGRVGYSDVVVIEEADTQCGNGGNRGGGTDITDPPDPPKPDPPSDTHSGGSGPRPAVPTQPSDPTPNPAPSPANGSQDAESSPEPVPPARPSEPPGMGAVQSGPTDTGSEALSDAESEPPSGPDIPPSPEASAAPETVPTTPVEGAAVSGPGLEAPVWSSGDTASAETMDSSPASSPAPVAPSPLPIAAGCTAVAATVGAAGLYLHPKAGRRIREGLKRLFKK